VRGSSVVVVFVVVLIKSTLMRIGVIGRFSPLRDASLGAIVDTASARGHEVVVLDIAALVTGPVDFSPTTGRLTLGDAALELGDLDVLWLGPLPSASARLIPEDGVLRGVDIDVLRRRQAARHALGWSIALVAEARGVPVLSSPSRARPFDFKPFQLSALAAAGITVPFTRVSDHADKDGVGDGIVKPVVGGPVVVAGASIDVAGVPTIHQPRLGARQLRLAVVDGGVVAAGAIVADDVIDSRVSVRPWRAISVDVALQDLGERCARACAFDVCAIDVVDGDGDLVVLDVNRTPQFMDLAALCDVDIAGCCVDLLERRGARSP
jgi:glutathione synthase/RimK-type ligase-like ATP-grasp enzyme